jgi:hypothetical protein
MSAWAYRAKPRETAVRPESSTCQTASRTAVGGAPLDLPVPGRLEDLQAGSAIVPELAA